MKWYSDSKILPSPMEARIARILKKFRIKYFREVSFKDFVTPKGYSYRYDFYFPDRNLILEYDGFFHKRRKVKRNDKIKNKFCEKNKIRIVRFNKENFKTLEKDLKQLFYG